MNLSMKTKPFTLKSTNNKKRNQENINNWELYFSYRVGWDKKCIDVI